MNWECCESFLTCHGLKIALSVPLLTVPNSILVKWFVQDKFCAEYIFLQQTDFWFIVLSFVFLNPFLLDIYKQTSYQLCDHDAAASSPAVSVAVEEYEPVTNSLFAPSIPWDLVQRWQAPDPPGIYQK